MTKGQACKQVYTDSGQKRKQLDNEDITLERVHQCYEKFYQASQQKNSSHEYFYGTALMALLTEKLASDIIDRNNGDPLSF